ncbi:MAG: hypothetical protein GWN58_12610 [Anaerolineae bacterium]|nr:hypothetical protein [Anaerolineae bacterium]
MRFTSRTIASILLGLLLMLGAGRADSLQTPESPVEARESRAGAGLAPDPPSNVIRSAAAAINGPWMLQALETFGDRPANQRDLD